VLRNVWNAARRRESLAAALRLTANQLWASLVAGGRNMMPIGVAVAAAGIIVGVVNLGLGARIVEVVHAIAGGNFVLLLLITAVASLVLGMGLPTTANYIVMVILTVPLIRDLSAEMGFVVPLIAAHLFCFFFGILADDTPPVGLSAYAAAAISKADPIRTGIQGFKYDIRTAILPFMFIFNTDLLLINVSGVGHIVIILITGVIAMFAFASLTQNFLLRRNRIHEAILLALTVFLLLRPDLFAAQFGVSKFIVYILGLAVFVLVYGLQISSQRASDS